MTRYVLRCRCGKCIAVNSHNRNASYQQYINNIRARFGVTTFEELVDVYRCRVCRKNPREPITRRVSIMEEFMQLQNDSVELQKLKVVGSGIDLNIDDYKNFFVGFEFEFKYLGFTT